MNKAYLLLGSNIEPEKNIPLAVQILSQHPDLKVLQVSSTWQTPSIGHEAPDFHNAAVCVKTHLDSYVLKENVLCQIEHEMGRIRLENKNAPRTIDLDIEVYNGEILDPEIFIQHHLMLPLAEILPDLISPEQKLSLAQIAALAIPHTTAKKLA